MTTTAELRASYEDILRGERYDFTDRISTAIDDYVQNSRRGGKGGNNAVGWGCPRVKIAMSELRTENPGMSQELRTDPLRHLRALEAACHAIASEERPGYDKENVRVKVALAGPMGSQPCSPRSLTSANLKQLVCVEGVATKVSTIKPKVVESVHYCPATKQHESREYIDATDPSLGLHALDRAGQEIPDRIINITSSVYPTKDNDGNPTETEFGMCTYKDHQTICLQEMPERAPMGQLPRSVELVLDYDLVDRIKPGDRVQIVGVFRALATTSNGSQTTHGTFKSVILVNNVQILGRDTSHLDFSVQDIRSIRSLAKREDILEVLGRSIAPSIHGHEEIKKALALQQLSGCEKNLHNGTHLRGDINILMVGDPSTAKSQLLRSAMTMAPLAVSTTGKGSSGVGLTAAVTSDPDTRERRLEAGAMVLADRGLVCVDEFDKMGENDRVAIHEAMEQQTVTIAKAGIHASLNARCSVLAAANPVYGQYDRKRRIQENIGLPDSLLSRFDLLFVVLDQLDPETDRMIAEHVILSHRSLAGRSTLFGHGGYGNDSDMDEDDSDDEEIANGGGASGTKSIWQRRQHVNKTYTLTQDRDDDDPNFSDVLQHDFLRKFLHFAKARMNPVLTDGARDFIATRYAEMRTRQDERTLPVTARSLETIIRLATAHAKARLSDVVEAEPDCAEAMKILGFALYHETSSDAQSMAIEVPVARTKEEFSDSDIENEAPSNESKRRKLNQELGLSPAAKLKATIWGVLEQNDGAMAIGEVCPDIEDRKLVETAIQEMVANDQLQLDDDVVYQLQ